MFSHLLNGFSKQSNNSTRLCRLWLLMEKSVQLNDLYWQTPKRPDKLNSYHFWLSSKNIQNLNWAISSWSFDFDCLFTRWHFYFLFFLSSWSNYKIIALLLLQVAPGVLSLSWQHQRHIPRSDMCNTHTPLRHHHSTSLFCFVWQQKIGGQAGKGEIRSFGPGFWWLWRGPSKWQKKGGKVCFWQLVFILAATERWHHRVLVVIKDAALLCIPHWRRITLQWANGPCCVAKKKKKNLIFGSRPRAIIETVKSEHSARVVF